MIFTIDNIITSIADQLAYAFPDVNGNCIYPIRKSPTEKTEFPCFFIFVTQATIDDQPSERMLRGIGFDIVFVQQRNADDQNDSIYKMADKLDEAFHMLNYNDKFGTALLHTQERNWNVEDQELHYKFTLRARVRFDREAQVLMQVMEETNVEIKDY